MWHGWLFVKKNANRIVGRLFFGADRGSPVGLADESDSEKILEILFCFFFGRFFFGFFFFFFVGVRAEGSDVGATSRASENDVHWLCISAPNIAPSTARTNRLAAS